MTERSISPAPSIVAPRIRDWLGTALLWGYFVAAFVAVHGFVMLVLMMVSRSPRVGAQRAIRYHVQGFWQLFRALAPRIAPDPEQTRTLAQVRGSVVVANHLSFLDPLLLIVALKLPTTLVRRDFFRVPLFGWVLRACGYLEAGGAEGAMWLQDLTAQLAEGGNVFVFPEGTRSRDGALTRFRRGAFHVARQLGVALQVVRIDGTDRVFPPRSSVLRLGRVRRIQLRHVATLSPAEIQGFASTEALMSHVRQLLEPPNTEDAEQKARPLTHPPEP